jgi:hypothetical protein
MRHVKHTVRHFAVPIFFGLISVCLPLKGQYDVNLVKAAYIERMTRFVEWPARTDSAENRLFTIGVYGDNDFYVTMCSVFKDKQVKNLNVKVVQVRNIGQMAGCMICYISGKAGPAITEIVNAANSSGILLISDSSDFGTAGVHINFYIESDKLKFEINEKSISSAGFKVSYLLMQNTRIIR